jgi:serine/threonine protein kinase
MMVMEHLPGGSLWDLLRDEGVALGWEAKMQLALQITSGLRYLHEQHAPIVHCDLKAENVFLRGQASTSREVCH